jgi:type I restriction enzyme S subunit
LKINVCARGIFNILPKKNVYNQYLYYILLKNRNKFQRLATGAVIKHFSGSNFMNFQINLPNKKIQKQIIDIIEPIEKIENCTYNLIQNLLKLVSKIKNNKNIFKLSNVSELIKNKPKNLQQVSAKVLNKRVSFINEIENINTYKTNIFYCKKNTLLINTIRTYLEK